MPRIPRRKVRIRRVYLVDCQVCGEGVEVELSETSGGFASRGEAEDAKQRHLNEHAETTIEQERMSAEVNPYLRYKG